MRSKHAFAISRTRHGAVAILVAVLLTVVIGILAISMDGGLLLDNRRKVQGACDAAALAAGAALFANYPQIATGGFGSCDPNGAGAVAALASAASNGFTNQDGRSTVEVHIPPITGPFRDKAGYAEVTIAYEQPRYFSRIWGSAPTTVVARAVARARWGGTNIGVLVMDPTSKDALNASGTGSITVTGGTAGSPGAAVIVNSDNTTAAAATGGGGITAAAFEITGGYTGALHGPVETNVPPSADPLRYLPQPSKGSAGVMSVQAIGKGNKRYRLSPGFYTNLPTFNVGDEVILQQGGIIHVAGGGFKSTGASITMDPNSAGGVMIYNDPSGSAQSEQLQISGNSAGTVNLSALTSGPYAGILLWQNRTATQALSVSGGGNFRLRGTFYAANAALTVTGNGDAIIGSQYISRMLNLGGGGNTLIQYTDSGTARLREVLLVE